LLVRAYPYENSAAITTVYEQFCSSLDGSETKQFELYKAAAERRKSLKEELRKLQIVKTVDEETSRSNEAIRLEAENGSTGDFQASETELSQRGNR
jgi:hypothetical protein